MSKPILPPALLRELPTDRTVGITTTVPVEVILAAGLVPVDLNNLFVTANNPGKLIERAERAGFPGTCCCWTKGIYGAVHERDIHRVVAVTRGDCSNAGALMEVLEHEGVETIGFDYPAERDEAKMRAVLRDFAARLGAAPPEAEETRRRLRSHRSAAELIDRLTFRETRVHGLENHLWLVSSSDFCADPDRYLREAEDFARTARERSPLRPRLRIGLCGIPPIVLGLYDYIEEFGGLVVYNETQRQFAMPGAAESLSEQYSRYTYPYGVKGRIEDIRRECERRRVHGLIHYVQSFCHRRIQDRIIRDEIDLPVLTLEADRPGPLSGQLETRIEAFMQMLEAGAANPPKLR